MISTLKQWPDRRFRGKEKPPKSFDAGPGVAALGRHRKYGVLSQFVERYQVLRCL